MIIIENAKLISMAQINYEVVDILINEKKIQKIGKNLRREFPEATIIDVKGNYVTPGLVDPHCHIGIYEEAIGFEGGDGNEMTNPIYPELRALDAVKPQDVAFIEARESGVTTVATGPGSANVIGGLFCVLKTFGKTIDDMVIIPESSMKMALGENPKRVYSASKQSPSTRMATAALMRDWLRKARDYKIKKEAYFAENKDKDVVKPFDYDMKLESLSRVYDGLLVKIHAHQQDDIVTAIRIIEEFGLNATIEHATEAHLIPQYIKDHNIRLILGPTLGSKSKYELRNKSFKSAKILFDAGVEFAIMTDHPVIHSSNALTQLGLFVREGLEELEALKAITIHAARINGVDDRVGSIEEGKDADIVVWDNHPLHYMTKPEYVFIDGNIVHKK